MSTATYPAVDGTQLCLGQRGERDYLFFPARDDAWWAVPEAKALCTGCPFRRACLRYALAFDLYGVWGGTSQNERRVLQRKHGIKPTPVTVPAALIGETA